MGQHQIPNLIVLNNLARKEMVHMNLSHDGLSAIEARVSLVSLKKWNILGKRCSLLSIIQIYLTDIIRESVCLLASINCKSTLKQVPTG